MDTERFIRSLADDLKPVIPLGRPWRRTATWTAAAVLYLVVLIVVMSPRDDLGARMQEPWFVIEQMAALLTGLVAAVAAFASVVPGYRRSVILLPLAPLTAWLGIVGVGALQDLQLSGQGQGGLVLQSDWGCVATILAGAAVPAVAMAVMLRRGAPLTPHVTAGLGGLAAAGLGNLGVCLFHPHSSNVVVLFWHCGTVLLLAALAAWAGSHLLRWPPAARMPHVA